MEIEDLCHTPSGGLHAFIEKTVGPEGSIVSGKVQFLLGAPSGTTIATFRAQRDIGIGAWDPGLFWEASNGDNTELDSINSPQPGGGGVTYNVNSPTFRVTLVCSFVVCLLPQFGAHTTVRMNNPVATFEDLVAPSVTFGARPAGPVTGKIQIPLTALDQGGGITKVEVLADGVAVGSLSDSNNGHCASLNAPPLPPAYIFVVPCKLQLGGTVELDTTKLKGNGSHTLKAIVTDVSGQQGEASTTIEVRNAPANSGRPKLSGAAAIGAQLTSTRGEWSGLSATYAFQWLRCEQTAKADQEAGCTPIEGAAADNYAPAAADVGKRLVAKVTATNPSGTSSALSAPSEVVPPDSPRLSGVKLTRKRFHVGRRATVLRWRSSKAARLIVKVTPARARGKAKRARIALRPKIKAGPGRRPFTGRIARKPLPPGPYRMTVTATDADGNVSAPVKLRFTVLPG